MRFFKNIPSTIRLNQDLSMPVRTNNRLILSKILEKFNYNQTDRIFDNYDLLILFLKK